MFISRLKEKYKPGQSIFAEDILSLFPEFTRAYVFRMINSAISNDQLVRFSRGVYCLPKQSIFGLVTLSSGQVAENKYIRDDDSVYGIYAGLTLLNQFGLTSQVPNVLEIVTNNEATRKRPVTIDGMNYILRRSRFPITKDNYYYYIILQLFTEIKVGEKLDDYSISRIKTFIKENNLKFAKLVEYAMFFPKKTIKNLTDNMPLLDLYN